MSLTESSASLGHLRCRSFGSSGGNSDRAVQKFKKMKSDSAVIDADMEKRKNWMLPITILKLALQFQITVGLSKDEDATISNIDEDNHDAEQPLRQQQTSENTHQGLSPINDRISDDTNHTRPSCSTPPVDEDNLNAEQPLRQQHTSQSAHLGLPLSDERISGSDTNHTQPLYHSVHINEDDSNTTHPPRQQRLQNTHWGSPASHAPSTNERIFDNDHKMPCYGILLVVAAFVLFSVLHYHHVI